MPKDPKQSAKLLFLKDCFEQECDEEQSITLQDIKRYLARNNVYISKDETITEAIQALGRYGYGLQIDHPDHSKKYFYYPDRETKLQPVEIQMLVDCIQSTKFLTERDTDHIIDKLLLLCSKVQAEKIRNSARYSRPTKNNNPDTLVNLHILMECISQNCQVSFIYGSYDSDKRLIGKPEPRTVSPLSLLYTDDNYYMMAWNKAHDALITYRIDRIVGQAKQVGEAREQTRKFSDYDKKYYTQQSFHMFSGELTEVTLLCSNYIMNTIIDQFGYSIHVHQEDDEHFSISPKLCATNQFFGWVLGLGGAVKITGPEDIVQRMTQMLEDARKQYT